MKKLLEEINDDKTPSKPWRTFTVHYEAGDWLIDPNRWTITRENGLAIIEQDGEHIDTPTDTGQTDVELIRWGIIWCVKDDVEICLAGIADA